MVNYTVRMHKLVLLNPPAHLKRPCAHPPAQSTQNRLLSLADDRNGGARLGSKPLFTPMLGLLLGLGLAQTGLAATTEPCNASPPTQSTVISPATAPRLTIEASSSESELNGKTFLQGPVDIQFGNQHVSASQAEYAEPTQQVDAFGEVIYQTPQMSITSSGGRWNPSGAGQFDNSHFELPEHNARGSAKKIELKPDKKVILSSVSYSTCPVDHTDWTLKAVTVTLDQVEQTATANSVRLNVEGIPLLYLPVLKFPIGDQRRSGFLFPVISQSSTSGLQFQTPYYFNLAPNYDLTLTPGYSIKRGLTLNDDFRYEGAATTSNLKIDWLPHDQVANADRGYLRFDDTTDLSDHFRLAINTPYVSDVKYFQDFGTGTENTSVIYLDRDLSLEYIDNHWHAIGIIDQFQTIDLSVAPIDRPATRIPAISAMGHYGKRLGIGFDISVEADEFKKITGVDGARVRVEPNLHWASNINGIQLTETLGYSVLDYQLNNTEANQPTQLSVSAPFERFEGSALFERSQNNLLTQLEPKILYSYRPYRAQDNFPVFDTAPADLNSVELFRADRFQGYDRLEDQNQLAIGTTLRELDNVSGRQWLSATIGQILYFSTPQVSVPVATTGDSVLAVAPQYQIANHLNAMGYFNPFNSINPNAPQQSYPLGSNLLYSNNLLTENGLNPYGGNGFVGNNGLLAYGYASNGLVEINKATQSNIIPGSAVPSANSSDLVGQLDLTGPSHINLSLGELWDPHLKQSALNEARISYRPEANQVLNLSYRYRRGLLEQVEAGVAWPISSHWGLFARDIYSLKDHTQIDSFSGFQYQACCFKVELLARHYVSSFDGSRNTSIVFQVELNGLSTVSDRVGTFLEQAIRGYSPSDNSVSR